MSSSESVSSISGASNGAADEFYSRQEAESMVMEYEEVDTLVLEQDKIEEPVDSEDEYTYSGEPLADEEWLAKYNKEIEEELKQESMLKQRLGGTLSVSSW